MATLAHRQPRPVPWMRGVPVLFGLLSAVIVAQSVPSFVEAIGQGYYNGNDYRLYMDATSRWMATGVFYEPYQLAGPYSLEPGAAAWPILYPPVALWLFVPFTVLPAALWWGVPVAITGWVVWHHRPGVIAWPLIALCLAWPPTQIHVISGNPGLWAMAACALATVWPAFGPFVLIKPSLFPFAGVGIRHRAWWRGLAVFAVLSAALLPMWPDWLTVMANQSNNGGLLYSWQYAPMMLLPVIAAAFSRRAAARGRSAPQP